MVTPGMIRSARGMLAITLLAGCVTEFDERASKIEAVRVLGIRSTPAEAKPGEAVSYEALVVGPGGELTEAPFDWAFCTRPSSASELNDVSIDCFRRSAPYIVALGTEKTASGQLPVNACGQFGPDGSQAKPGEPTGRPADPDVTGGYYQPLRLLVSQGQRPLLALGTTRLSCGLPGATQEVLQAFKARYRPNENPRLSQVTVLASTQAVLSDSGSVSPRVVERGETLHLRASWPSCPVTPTCGDGICSPGEDKASCAEDCTTPRGCEGAETYVAFDTSSRELASRGEAMRVSWFSTAGSFESDHTGRSEEEMGHTDSDNAWTAPSEAGTVHLWVVLRDSRGGIDWRSYTLVVE